MLMGWELHPAKAAFSGFANEWDRLNREFYAEHPLFDSRFVGPLLECFATGKEQLCLYRRDGVVAGALILQPDRFGRWSTFRPSQSQATAIFLGDARLLDSLFKRLPGFAWTIELYAVDPRYSPDFSRLDQVRIHTPNAYTIGVDAGISFATYWEQRSKNLKANVRRYFNRAEKELSTPVLTIMTTKDDMVVGVRRFGELETAGWKGAAGTAVSIDNRQGHFYSTVLEQFAGSGQAAVYELHIGDQLAASRLVVTSGKLFVILKTTYDEALARFAPGRVLLYRVIQEQLENLTGKTIEFYTNATRDQAEWTTFGCTIENIQVFRNDLAALAFSLLKLLRRQLRSASHRLPAAEGFLAPAEVKSSDSVADLAATVPNLETFTPRDSIENSIDWFDLMQTEVFSGDTGVRFYHVIKDDRPALILPLRHTVQTTNLRVRSVESLGNFYTSLYAPLQDGPFDPYALRQILATATREHGGAHVMRFSPMDPHSPAYAALLNELQAIGWIPFRFFCFGNWYLDVKDDWDGYLKRRGANLRSRIKRKTRRFSAEGGSLEVVSAVDQLDEAISAFQAVYTASWKTPEPYPEFVPSLIRRLASLGMLRLGIARLQGRPIAAQLWIVGHGKASIYKVAYHEAFASYSPGTVLTSHLLKHVIETDRVSEVDFLIGDDDYKQIWMSNRRERWGVVAYNPRTLIGLSLLLREILARTAKSAWKALSNPVRKLRLRNDPAKMRSVTHAHGHRHP
jgi:CelD/BcsL family acetyltransferase involved in cellulose biosynthesis